jgi:uncharacterized protein YecE (DUF72 family)
MARFVHGTAGWSYKDWVGPFYEPGTPPGRFLARYAKRFPGAEVDATYYRIPTRKICEGWDRVTPDGFVFSPKLPGEITHKRFLEDCQDLVREFLDALEPLGPKLGQVIAQFPYFKRDSGLTLDIFLGRLLPFLDGLPEGVRFAVEVRNRDFLRPRLMESLAERNVALVLLDHAWMPPPRAWGKLEGAFTTDRVPIRLIGDRYGIEKITKTWEKVVVDKEDRLARWAEVIRKILDSGRSVTAFANNHYAGHGPATAIRLAELVGSVDEG